MGTEAAGSGGTVDLMSASFVGKLARTRTADASFLFATRAAHGQEHISTLWSEV